MVRMKHKRWYINRKKNMQEGEEQERKKENLDKKKKNEKRKRTVSFTKENDRCASLDRKSVV